MQCVRASCTDANWDPWFIVTLSYIEDEIGECCRVLTSQLHFMLCLSLFFVVGIYSYVDYVGLFDSFLSIFQNEPSHETSGPLDSNFRHITMPTVVMLHYFHLKGYLLLKGLMPAYLLLKGLMPAGIRAPQDIIQSGISEVQQLRTCRENSIVTAIMEMETSI